MRLLAGPGRLAAACGLGVTAFGRFLFREHLGDFGRAIYFGVSVFVLVRSVLGPGMDSFAPWDLAILPLSAAAMFCLFMRLSYGSWRPRNWLPATMSHRVELNLPEMFLSSMDPAGRQVVERLRLVERRWCQDNCRGRWRVVFHYAYFARKEEAASFILMQGGMDQD